MKTFCQICRHPSDEGIGHELNCPVYTGEPVTQSMPCPYCGGRGGQHIWDGSGTCPGASTHWSENATYYPYGPEVPIYASFISNQETRDILVRLDLLEEENRRLWEAMRYIPGTPMWQP